jgi:hypothetical protein
MKTNIKKLKKEQKVRRRASLIKKNRRASPKE